MLAEAEIAIIKRIQAVLAPFEVNIFGFPGDSDEVPTPGRRGQILIGYKRSRFRVVSFEPITCEQTAEFELMVELSDLRSHQGAYPLLDTVRYAVTGFLPLAGGGCPSKCYPVIEGFQKVDDGVWIYSIIIAVSFLLREGINPAYTAPLPDPNNPINPDTYYQVPDDYINLDPGTPAPPYIPQEIRSGVRVVRVGKISNPQGNESLDREIIIENPNP